MAPTKTLLLFGDQTLDIPASLNDLFVHRRKSQNLDAFLKSAIASLRYEVAEFDFGGQSFSSVLDLRALLAPLSENPSRHVAVQTFLTTVIQLGNLILRMESEPRLLDSGSDVALIGICTGILAAVAASVANSLQELLEISANIVVVALRFGQIMQRRASALESSTESWAFTVAKLEGTEVDEAIATYNKAIPSHRRVYVSSRAQHAFTVSGPPTNLAEIRGLYPFQSCKTLDLPIYAPYHASHLHDDQLRTLLGIVPYHTQQRPVLRSLISTASGKPFQTTRMGELLLEALKEVLERPITWPQLLGGLEDTFTVSDVILEAIGSTNIPNYLVKELQLKGINVSKASSPVESPILGDDDVDSGDIAIVGMSGRFPGAEDLESLWRVLEDGLDLHRQIPPDRFDVQSHCDPTGNLRNSTLTPFGVFIDQPGLFDVRLFNMSPREAKQTDPMQRLLLITTYEALEMAGYSPGRTPSSDSSRIGTFFGQTSDDWREVNASQDVDTFFITGGIRAFGPGRLNYHFKWDGPSYSIDTACSSSAASIQLACSALLAREIDTAVAGGANILTANDLFAGLSRGGFLSKTGGCKTFDDEADGYCRGDAVGTVVLKRLADAIVDNDKVLAVIKAVSTNHSSQAVSITHPHAATQQALFEDVLRKSNLTVNDIDAVELHGTGTQAGDFTEFSSVMGVFGNQRSLDRPIYVGTVKPNLGHGEAASGVTSLMKSILMLKHNSIPPHIGIKHRINHRLPPLETVPIKLALSGKVAWPKPPSGKRRVLINNFDAAGGNTSMVIEDPPMVQIKDKDPRNHHVVAISGRTLLSFEQNRTQLLDFLKHSDVAIDDLSYTTTARRQHHIFRRAYSANSTIELIKLLEQDTTTNPPDRQSKPKIVLVFTGQGSQFSGMGKQLFATHPSCRRWFNEYDKICTQLGFDSFLGLITGDLALDQASPSQAQLALTSFEMVVWRLWRSWALEPDAVIGHSIGEYASLVAAGVLSAWDALYLVGTRAKLLERNCKAGTHSMLAVNLPSEKVTEILAQHEFTSCEISCINGPSATVVGGEKEEVEALQGSLTRVGTKTSILRVQYAFHSQQMDSVLEEFEAAASYLRPTYPDTIIASPVTGTVIHKHEQLDPSYLISQCRKPVNFVSALRGLQDHFSGNDPTVWVELGPKPVCLGMVRSTLDIAPARLVPTTKERQDDWATLSGGLSQIYNAGFDINWQAVHREHESSLSLINLPSYAFDLKNYWIQYEGDWSITKGREAGKSPPSKDRFSTTSLQKLVSETVQEDTLTVVFSSNILDPKLIPAIEGHQVSRSGLCPSSLYADMALTAATYVQSKLSPTTEVPSMDVADMEVMKPLVANSSLTEQILFVTAHKKEKFGIVYIEFSSELGATRTQHATCTVSFGNRKQWVSEWHRQKYLIDGRIERLKFTVDGVSHRIMGKLVYKLFSTLVNYSERYQGLKKVYLDSEAFEAVGVVKASPAVTGEAFHFSPYWIDSLLHLSGFVLNGSDRTPEDAVYISHGWKSLRLPTKLDPDRSYQTYVRMQPLESEQIMAGDVYILEDDSIVGLCVGLKFQKIKKSILGHLLPNRQSPPPKPTAPFALIPARPKTVVRTEVPTSDLFDQVVAIIADEAGVLRTDVHNDNVEFAEIGIDSLLSLSITTQMRELTGFDIPTSFFITHPKVADLRNFLIAYESGTSSSVQSDSEDSDDLFERDNISTAGTSAENLVLNSTRDLSASVLKRIVAEELGVADSEIQSSTEWTDIGLDSLMSLVIINTVKDATGHTLTPDFFIRQSTFGDVQRLYQKSDIPPAPVPAHPDNRGSKSRDTVECTSVVLQGSSSCKYTLFLIPDGSGSSASYAGLPLALPDTAVIGLNSQYLGNSAPFQESIETTASKYLREIRNRQPNGPYILGGWSIGGVYAYEIARQLALKGEVVSGIILVDAPCPLRLPPMPEATIDILIRHGIFGSQGKIAPALRAHFQGSVRALQRYTPLPLPPGISIPCIAVWASDGVFQTPSAIPSSVSRELAASGTSSVDDWILFPRKSHDSTGWDDLLSDYKPTVVSGNHFTMMKQPHVQELGQRIQTELRKLLRLR
ncbi:PKS16 protein [Lophiotrema nucula]|uniref:PKS16 protein n=1 Tax=Lophiotrema nucula TaxID=690887 RepID=A0A6A5YTE4_9PLEO|nr:PKS16 protein [Lophiotrema nucula]